MFVESLTLINYNPFLLRGVKKLCLHFTSIYQLIIGTNGTGKSSILRQLSPLPAVSSDFTGRGSKHIVIRHHGNVYNLISEYTEKGGSHQFICNNVNLNDSRTITSQRELVQKHFGLTQALFSLLIGETLFTKMSSNERRDWLLSISGMNLDYAMEVYERLRVKARESQNIFKHYTKRFNTEVENLPSDTVIDEIQEKVDSLNAVFLDLNRAKKQGLRNKAFYIEQCEQIYKSAMPLIKKVNEKAAQFGDSEHAAILRNEDSTIRYIKELDNAVKEDTVYLDSLNIDHYKLVTAISEINKGNEQGCLDVKERLENLESQFTKVKSGLFHLDFDYLTFKQIYKTTELIADDLYEIIQTTPINKDGRFVDSAIQQQQQQKTNLLNKQTQLLSTIDKLSHQLQHVKTTENTICPKCSYSWIIGYENADENTIQNKIDELTVLVNKNKIELELIDALLEDHDLYLNSLSRLRIMYKTLPETRQLLNLVSMQLNTTGNLRDAIPLMKKWTSDMSNGLRLCALQEQIDETKKAVDIINGEYKGRVQNLFELRDNQEALIEQTIRKIETQKHLIRELRTTRSLITELEKIGTMLNDSLESLEIATNDIRDIIVNDSLDVLIDSVRTELALLVTRLNEAKNAKTLVEKLKAELQDADRQFTICKLMVKLISPTDGIIAQKMAIFMSSFINHMNFIISKIWAHDFHLIDVTHEAKEIDYVFPTKIANSKLKNPDVSHGSSSQVDIVNFAFRLVVMLYLGLEQYPIYLDELAPSLDETHRANIIAFIKEFVDAKQCSQMFMISHYVANHGVFTQAEVCVTDSKNILTLPSVYNKHCVFE